MSYAIRYATITGAEHVTITGDTDATYAKAGRILYAALKRGHRLSYLTVVRCRKRPGTKPVFSMSRDSMSEEELTKWCKFFHRKAYQA